MQDFPLIIARLAERLTSAHLRGSEWGGRLGFLMQDYLLFIAEKDLERSEPGMGKPGRNEGGKLGFLMRDCTLFSTRIAVESHPERPARSQGSEEGKLGFLMQNYPPLFIARLAESLEKGPERSGWSEKSMGVLPGLARLRGEPRMLAPCAKLEGLCSGNLAVAITKKAPEKNCLSILSMPLPSLSLQRIMELVPQTQKQQQVYPDKHRLESVQEFYHYTEIEGRHFFKELDRDSDGQVTLEDLKAKMAQKNLPQSYAQKFMQGARSNCFAKSLGLEQFVSVLQKKEPVILRLFNSISMNDSGTVERRHMKGLLEKVGLPVTEANIAAVMDSLGVDSDGIVKYGQFRRSMMLLPREQLLSDPWSVWLGSTVSTPRQSKFTLVKPMFKKHFIDSLSSGFSKPMKTVQTWNAELQMHSGKLEHLTHCFYNTVGGIGERISGTLPNYVSNH